MAFNFKLLELISFYSVTCSARRATAGLDTTSKDVNL